jgi:hypothetical protein
MHLDYVPLLHVQREIQGMPRDRERFYHYLRTIWNCYEEDFELIPLMFANPMARDHVTTLLDELLALGADQIAATAAAEAAPRLPDGPGEFKASIVVCDDLKGGWTNRFDYEFKNRVGYIDFLGEDAPPDPTPTPTPAPTLTLTLTPTPTPTPTPTLAPTSTHPPLEWKPPKWSKFLWMVGTLWSSEPPCARAVREAILTAIYRVAVVQKRGVPRTLRAILDQEGEVMTLAGCEGPTLDEEDIAYTREVLTPLLDATDKRTCIECLFGDAAGRTLGFTPRGLSPWAGLALALHDARAASQPINR